jgi:hypothetical protein
MQDVAAAPGMYRGTQLDGLWAGETIRLQWLRHGDARPRESYAHDIQRI